MGYGGVKQDTIALQWDGNGSGIKKLSSYSLHDSHLTRTLNLLYILFSS
jgi:hypothetical protein